MSRTDKEFQYFNFEWKTFVVRHVSSRQSKQAKEACLPLAEKLSEPEELELKPILGSRKVEIINSKVGFFYWFKIVHGHWKV